MTYSKQICKYSCIYTTGRGLDTSLASFPFLSTKLPLTFDYILWCKKWMFCWMKYTTVYCTIPSTAAVFNRGIANQKWVTEPFSRGREKTTISTSKTTVFIIDTGRHWPWQLRQLDFAIRFWTHLFGLFTAPLQPTLDQWKLWGWATRPRRKWITAWKKVENRRCRL